MTRRNGYHAVKSIAMRMGDGTAKGGHVLLRKARAGRGLATRASKGAGHASVEVIVPANRSGQGRAGGVGTDAPRSRGSATAGVGTGDSATRTMSRRRRLKRYLFQRLAVVVALLILFYATSLHGFGTRTVVLAALLVLALYWLFRDAL